MFYIKGEKKMLKNKTLFVRTLFLVFVLALTVTANAALSNSEQLVADVILGSNVVHFQPKVSYYQLQLKVSSPDGVVYEMVFSGDDSPLFTLPGSAGDGSWTFELVVFDKNDFSRELAGGDNLAGLSSVDSSDPSLGQSGSFLVLGGAIYVPDLTSEGANQPLDFVTNDDSIVIGSLCVGFDCVNGESFGFDTIRLKENNLRIHFDDTSTSASFPRNDWRIVINDSSNGGASYFAVEDSTAGRIPFRIEAGAPANSLYVDDGGRVGIGTSTPVLELHVTDGDTPSLRLEQNGTQGWTPQTWDVAGNETNFFVRDVTHSSNLPFRIKAGARDDSLFIASDGKIGFGTDAPTAELEIKSTGDVAQILLDRASGAQAQFTAKENVVNIGSRTNHPVKFFVNQVMSLNLKTDGSMLMGNGAQLTAAGVWQNASSITLKENVMTLDAEHAVKTLENLEPVIFNYKKDKNEKYVGFIAENVPALVASNDRKSLSPMDVVAVLTKVVQQQQKTIADLEKKISLLEK
jgi:hypothetical protein